MVTLPYKLGNAKSWVVADTLAVDIAGIVVDHKPVAAAGIAGIVYLHIAPGPADHIVKGHTVMAVVAAAHTADTGRVAHTPVARPELLHLWDCRM